MKRAFSVVVASLLSISATAYAQFVTTDPSMLTGTTGNLAPMSAPLQPAQAQATQRDQQLQALQGRLSTVELQLQQVQRQQQVQENNFGQQMDQLTNAQRQQLQAFQQKLEAEGRTGSAPPSNTMPSTAAKLMDLQSAQQRQVQDVQLQNARALQASKQQIDELRQQETLLKQQIQALRAQ